MGSSAPPLAAAAAMNWVVLSDLTSALVAALNAHLHHQGHIGMQAGEQFISSVVGRWLAALSPTLGINFAVRDAIGVFLTRSLLAMLWNERRAGVHGFDAVMADRVGLLLASVIPGSLVPSMIGENYPYSGAMTGPAGPTPQ